MTKRGSKQTGTHVIRSHKELKALCSPVRQDIVFVLESLGPSSVSEIAERLGRSPHSLYYHVRELERVGLVSARETRRTTRRDAVVYALVSEGILIDPQQRSKAFLQTLGEMYSASLRRAERETLFALANDAHVPPDEPRNSGVFTVNARLTPRSRKLMRKRLLELGDLIEAEDDPRGEATVLTIAVHPGLAHERE
jgi:predicted transcriptional regulator